MNNTKPLVLTGLDSLRLLSAFQVLSVPSGMMGVTHRRAREVVTEMTGKAPKRGVKFPPGASLADLLSIHLARVVHIRQEARCQPGLDCQVTEGAVPEGM